MTPRPTRPARAVAAAAAAGALIAATAGCSDTSQAAAPAPASASLTLSTTAPIQAPTPTASPSKTPTAKDKAIAQAKQAIRDYYKVTDRLAADPKLDPKVLETVAISTGLVDAQNIAASDRYNKYRAIGSTKIASMKVTKTDLTFKPKRQPPGIPTVQIDVCYDVSDVNVVDENGKSVITSSRKDKALEKLGVSNYNWPNPKGWKVSFSETKGKLCPSIS